VIDTGKYREMRFVSNKCPLINVPEIFVDLTRSDKSVALWKHLLPKAMLLRGADVLDEYKVDCASICSPKSVTTHRWTSTYMTLPIIGLSNSTDG